MNTFLQVYTGEGKGKTTAAIGLAVRAAGHGLKVYFGQFMKGQNYSELNSFKLIPNIENEQLGDPGWVYKGKLKVEQIEQAQNGFKRVQEVLRSEFFDLVILDEVIMAVWFGLLKESQLIKLIEERPKSTELVLTGRYASDSLIEKADLVTEMKPIKHYFEQGVKSRRGIEN